MTLQILANDDITEIKYVYHLSDIHIRILYRKREYEQIFEKTKEKLKELVGPNIDNVLIVVTGDIMHNKTELSPEAFDMANYFFTNLAEVAPVIIIAGNHDCNLTNLNRTDALSPIIRNGEHYEKCNINDPAYKSLIIRKYKNHDLYYLRKSGFYRYYNIVFGVTSVFDNTLLSADKLDHNDFKKIKQKNKYKIALYHGTVDGSKIDSGHKLVNENLNAGDFKGYDYVMLGDIHKFQYLNKEKTIAYSGSLIQQSHGESIENHGFLRWNLFDNTKKYFEIANDYGYCTININNGKIIETRIPKKPRIRFVLENTSHSQYLKIRKKFIEKYPACEIAKEASIKLQLLNGVIKNYIPNNDNTTSNDTMHIIKIKNYLIKKGKNNEDINLVVSLHKKIYNNILSEKKNDTLNGIKLSNNQNWDILELRFSNMLSYGENNVIDFTHYEFNQIIGIFAPNHYGKSAIIDIILYCLFGMWSRGGISDIMNKDKNSMFCSLKFKIGNKQYLIERSASKPKSGLRITGKTQFYTIISNNGIESKKILNGDSKKDTDKLICELVGDYDDYLTTCICLQQAKNDFIDMTAKRQMEYLQKILNVDIFYYCHEISNKKLKEIKIQSAVLEHQIKDFDINAIKNRMKQLLLDINLLKRKKAEYVKFIDAIVVPELPVLVKYNELDKYHLNTENDIFKNISALKTKINDLDSDLNNFVCGPNDVIKKYSKLNTEIDSTENDLLDLRNKSCKLSKKIINVPKKYHGYDYNLQCENKKSTEDKINKINTMICEFSNLSDHHLLSSIDKINIEINELKKTIVPVNPDTNKLLDVIDKKIIKNEVILLDTYGKNLDKLHFDNISDKNNLRNIINIKDKYSKHIDNINNRLDLCIDKNISNHIRNILLSIVNDNKKLLDGHNTWKKKINEILESYKNVSSISDLIEKNKKLKNERIKLIFDFFILIEVKNNKNIIKKLKTSKEKLVDVISSRKELKLMIDQLSIIDDTIIQLNHKNNNDKIMKKIDQNEEKIKTKQLLIEKMKKNKMELQNQIKYNSNILETKQLLEDEIKLLHKYYWEFKNWDIVNNSRNKNIEQTKIFETEIAEIDKLCNKYQYEYDSLKKDLKLYRINKSDYDNKIKEQETYETYTKMMTNKGLASVMVKGYLPLITAEINNVLSSFIDFSIEMIFIEDDDICNNGANKNKKFIVGKNKKYFGSLDISICYKDKQKYSIKLASGFEKFIVSIAIRMTLSHISLSAKPNFFIIDEGWSCMDNENRNNIDIVMNYIKELYDHVIIISHLEELKSQSDYNINIERLNNFSHVSNRRCILNTTNKKKNSKLVEV